MYNKCEYIDAYEKYIYIKKRMYDVYIMCVIQPPAMSHHHTYYVTSSY